MSAGESPDEFASGGLYELYDQMDAADPTYIKLDLPNDPDDLVSQETKDRVAQDLVDLARKRQRDEARPEDMLTEEERQALNQDLGEIVAVHREMLNQLHGRYGFGPHRPLTD